VTDPVLKQTLDTAHKEYVAANPVGYIATLDRKEQERRGKIRTFTGKYVDPMDLKPEDIDIEDIAHHLACVNRYTGASPFPMSVAQHSVWVSENVGDDLDLQLAGLLHDAPEAYINDLASPMKHKIPMYVEADVRASAVVFAVFGLPIELLAMTKPADDKAFRTEVASFWKPETLTAGEVIHEITWRQAKTRFMERYISIQRRRGVETL
jgi:hypothetical protein